MFVLWQVSFNKWILRYFCQVPVPPILGSYQLREEGNQLCVSVTLKLHESVKNCFEYCEAHMPFFNRYVAKDDVICLTRQRLFPV